MLVFDFAVRVFGVTAELHSKPRRICIELGEVLSFLSGLCATRAHHYDINGSKGQEDPLNKTAGEYVKNQLFEVH